jgi:hypothetical protein
MNRLFTLLLIVILSGCYITSYTPDPIYEDHPHSTEIYYNGIDVYWGYHTGFYYYYGTPHFIHGGITINLFHLIIIIYILMYMCIVITDIMCMAIEDLH